MTEGTNPIITGLAIAAVLGTGAMAGVFYTFSTFVMSGLRRLPPAQGAAAMQEINVAAPQPPLMLLLGGTAVLCVVLLVRGVLTLGERSGVMLVIGAALYLAGAVVVTGWRNVPMNDTLAALDPNAATTASYWSTYLDRWVSWNHVRTIACAAAALAFTLALVP